jgi:hypothetical protein
MPTDIPPVAAPQPAPALATAPESADFEQRWAAWQAKGSAHDRAFRRKMAVAAPILIVAAIIIYALLGR